MKKNVIAISIVACLSIIVLISQFDTSSGAIGVASSHYVDGEYNQAITKSLRTLREHELNDEQKAELHYIMAQSYEQLGEEVKSTALYKFIINTYPDSTVALLAKTEL